MDKKWRRGTCVNKIPVWFYIHNFGRHQFVVAAKSRTEASSIVNGIKRLQLETKPEDFARAKTLWSTATKPRILNLY